MFLQPGWGASRAPWGIEGQLDGTGGLQARLGHSLVQRRGIMRWHGYSMVVGMLCFVTSQSLAQPPRSEDGNYLLEKCTATVQFLDHQPMTTHTIEKAAWCMGYIQGLSDGQEQAVIENRTKIPPANAEYVFCTAQQNIPTAQLIRVSSRPRKAGGLTVDMVLHPTPCHDGAPPLPSPLPHHRPKKAPALAIPRFLPALREKDHVLCTIPLCVAQILRR